MQLAAPRDHVLARAPGLLDPQRDVAFELVDQALVDLAAGDIAPLAPGEGAVVDLEDHAHRRVLDLDRRQGPGVGRVGQRVADAHPRHARDGDDRARLRLVNRLALEVAEDVDLTDGLRAGLAVGGDMDHRLAGAQHAAAQAPHGDLADIAAVFEGGDQQAGRGLGLYLRRRQVADDGVEEGPQVGRQAVRLQTGAPVEGAGVDHRKVRLLVFGPQVHEEVEGRIHHRRRARRRPVDLVDHHHNLVAALQRLAQHETGLRHGPLDRVNQQDDAVHHVHYALDLAAEVGVAGGVDDIDGVVAVEYPRVLGQDGDAALALEVVRVQHALGHFLVGPEHVGLAQHAVDQGGLAVVDVGDDGHVADGVAAGAGRGRLGLGHTVLSPGGAGRKTGRAAPWSRRDPILIGL